jgi:hypothetical protein
MAKDNPTEKQKPRRPQRKAPRTTIEEPSHNMAVPSSSDANDRGMVTAPALPLAATPGRSINRVSAEGARKWPAPDDVARRAYEIYHSRGGGHGRHLEDWLQAERELRAM